MTILALDNRGATQRATEKVTQVRVIVSEWVKLRSLRSTIFTLLAAVVCTVGLGALVSNLRANDFIHNGPPGPMFDVVASSLRGIYLAQLPIGVLGVLVITGEYSTGMIRATLSAVPKRLPVLWAKALVFAVVVLAIGLVASFAAFLIGQAAFHRAGLGVSLGSSGALRAVVGGGLYLMGVGLLGVGLGFILRNTAGAIASLFGLLLVLPALVNALPSNLYNDINKFLPLTAGTQIMSTRQDHSLLGPWSGIAVLGLYAIAAIGIGAFVLKRADA